jgi:hypothetical protein
MGSPIRRTGKLEYNLMEYNEDTRNIGLSFDTTLYDCFCVPMDRKLITLGYIIPLEGLNVWDIIL